VFLRNYFTQPACGDRAPKGGEGIQCKFSTGREGAIEESEVVIWVGGVLLNAASDFREAYFHWRGIVRSSV
jgi:hypothetical protein